MFFVWVGFFGFFFLNPCHFFLLNLGWVLFVGLFLFNFFFLYLCLIPKPCLLCCISSASLSRHIQRDILQSGLENDRSNIKCFESLGQTSDSAQAQHRPGCLCSCCLAGTD